ncbi:MAG: recombination regulator RecX [Acidobacteriia bacterium]|nr:recombination regulator RecX [Terriglobia bacterium]
MAFGGAKKFYDEAGLYEYAVGALARRMRSVAELKRLLRRRVEKDELGAALVELVIAKLKEQRYLNDAQYASTYSSLRRENDRYGRRRVVTELKSRGVHSEVIEKAVAGIYDGVNEEALARAYLRRKRLQKPADQKQAARVFRSLIRAGFGTRTIISILKKWDVDDEVLTALESEES